MRKSAIIVIAFVICLGWLSNVHAQMTDSDRNMLLSEIFKLESAKEKINADISKYDDEIRKCTASISKSDNFIQLARQKGNTEAETAARKALVKAEQAKSLNIKNRSKAELIKKRLEQALLYAKSGNKDIESIREQVEFETQYAEWAKKQQRLIQQRLKEPNKTAGEMKRSLMANVPPLPGKTFSQLQPGDVLLIEPEDGSLKKLNPISLGDNAVTAGENRSFASHTVTYLKEVNGTRLFMDNQPGQGPRIITEAEFQKTYGHRGVDVATLGKLAEPLNKQEADDLFHKAVEMAQKNRKDIANNWFGKPLQGTNYGVGGEDVVCSEASWALIKAGGQFLPKSPDRIKVENGIDFSPADFYNSPYFIVTPLQLHKNYGNSGQ